MALPSNTDLATLDYTFRGELFVQVEAKSLDSETLDIAYLGAPFVAVGPAAVTGPNVYVKVSGLWKQANTVYVRDGGVWKTASTVSTKVSGTWKS